MSEPEKIVATPIAFVPTQRGYMDGEGSFWTLGTFAKYSEDMRAQDLRFNEERDRRYNEINVEKEKALKIKETADLAALQLAREIQTYKDDKTSTLNEQFGSERSEYASKRDLFNFVEKIELAIKPLSEFVSASQGRQSGIGVSATTLVGAITVAGIVGGLLFKLSGG